MDGFEKRRHKRLPMRLDLLCRKLGTPAQKVHTGCVVNVGTGGLYFETTSGAFEPGDLTEVRLSVPPRAGLLEMGGTIRTFARVLRAESAPNPRADAQSSLTQGVALEFCRSPRLCL